MDLQLHRLLEVGLLTILETWKKRSSACGRCIKEHVMVGVNIPANQPCMFDVV